MFLIYRYASSEGEPELIKTGTYTTLGGIYHFCNRNELGVTDNQQVGRRGPQASFYYLSMPPRAAAPAAAPRAGVARGGAGRGSVGGGRGGGGRGQGHPANKRGLGADADPGFQASITALLGARRTEEQVEEQAEPTGETVKWKYNWHDGGDQDTLVDQEQIVVRKVVYKLFGAGRPGVLKAKGTEEDKYWVDNDDKWKEVPEEHERACERNRSGMLKILDGPARSGVPVRWLRPHSNQTIGVCKQSKLSHTTFKYHLPYHSQK